MLLIKGLNHCRIVGIWDKSGEVQNFYPENYGGYRSPTTPQEEDACLKEARRYYESCAPAGRTGEFDTITITREHAEYIGNTLAAYSLAGIDGESFLLQNLSFCRYCGSAFLPQSPSQEVCKNPECQRKRKADKMASYRARKKN